MAVIEQPAEGLFGLEMLFGLYQGLLRGLQIRVFGELGNRI